SAPQASTEKMRDIGIELRPVDFYRNQPTAPQPLPRLAFDRVLFTSSSTAEAYFDRYPEEMTAARQWIAVGPSTLKTLQQKGLTAKLLIPHRRHAG
ncbi:MAG: uroporphyrinogen-III synthase, partial [Kiritimatiellia bacterium]